MTVNVPEWIVALATWSLWFVVSMLATIGFIAICVFIKYRNTEIFKINW